ncbi:hypothetical protein RRF57_012556 [Xylaria bambusicola]|uniref:Uncharacterized protein n=1 Tax=Xylaria bambusicola TaxID=326684 RepID=A0AAN7V5R8_9PEZI
MAMELSCLDATAQLIGYQIVGHGETGAWSGRFASAPRWSSSWTTRSLPAKIATAKGVMDFPHGDFILLLVKSWVKWRLTTVGSRAM